MTYKTKKMLVICRRWAWENENTMVTILTTVFALGVLDFCLLVAGYSL